MKKLKKLLQKKALLQGRILCRYGKCVLDLVESAIAGELPLLDVVSDVGASSLELFREYQSVCDELQNYTNPGERELYHHISFPGRCQDCGKDVILDDVKHDSEPIENGIRRFFRCPYCNAEIQNVILCAAV